MVDTGERDLVTKFRAMFVGGQTGVDSENLRTER
jgi:hypothetical protein